jgi:hypothetical protein
MDVKAEARPAGKLWPSKQKPTAGQQGKYERQSRSKTIIYMALGWVAPGLLEAIVFLTVDKIWKLDK